MTDYNSRVKFLDISKDYAVQRIDNFLIKYLKGVPKTRIYRMIRKGEVRVNKGRVKPDYLIQTDDRIRIPPVRIAQPTKPPHIGSSLFRLLNAAILYEDQSLLIINKPSGLAVHGGSGIRLGMIEALRQMYSQTKFLELVHRLDRDTSGCIMVAKKSSMLKALHADLGDRKITKTYQALVAGHWPSNCQQVDARLKKYQLNSGQRRVEISDQGKAALTFFKVLRTFKNSTLIEAKPVTGRTHQIRIHTSHVGHPIIGDEKYADPEINKNMKEKGIKRLALHAAKLDFILPSTGSTLSVTAPMDPILLQAINNLEVY